MKRIGKPPRRYKFFFLNPYQDVRFSYCPKCAGKTKLRKVPLVIDLNFFQPIALNKACRYCPACDLLIAHQDEIDEHLVSVFTQESLEKSLKDYWVLGTMERSDWQRSCDQSMTPTQITECLYGFKQTLKFEPSQWVKLNVAWKLIDSTG